MRIKKFENIGDFAEDRKINRLIYSTMSYKEKKELKEYIYNLKERTGRKDLIWEYLNEPIGTDYYVYISILIKKYVRRKK